MNDCSGTADCTCVHCEDVRAHERRKIASALREHAYRYMPTKINNDKMRRACASNLAYAVEHGRLEIL